MDLLITFTCHSELQVITVQLPIFTLYKSPQHTLSLFAAFRVFISRSLVTVSNSGNSSASRSQVLYSQLPVQNSCLNLQMATLKVRVRVNLISSFWAEPLETHGKNIFLT
jgi:hypothetical protein